MRCSSRVTVYHLKRFLLGKLSVPPLYDVSCYGICKENNDCVQAFLHGLTRKCFHPPLKSQKLDLSLEVLHCWVGCYIYAGRRGEANLLSIYGGGSVGGGKRNGYFGIILACWGGGGVNLWLFWHNNGVLGGG